ncbi:2-keto-4-pentenoate hydratase [Vibrio ishigakensis]|uniref:2-keto-4-pentenoate hydratase n=1 Tax=Vibrio ishigakensis TaxID=1481914 RepID=A0A0B8QNP8_9VIBR|nr:2-keto-4-pentenoate hydratase [Vibrio ishigakensis]
MEKVYLNGAVIAPTKLVCIGRNYVEHISELGNEIPDEMVVFNKPNSSITSVLKSGTEELSITRLNSVLLWKTMSLWASA